MNPFDAREHFKIARIEVGPGSYGCEDGLAFTGGAVYGKAHPDQMFNHILDLLVGGRILHGNDHK
jgi:hypothetical protein